MNRPVRPMLALSNSRSNEYDAARGEPLTVNRDRTFSLIDPLVIKYLPLIRLVIVLAVLLLSYLIVDSLPGDDWRHLSNYMGPSILLSVCSWSAYDIVRANPLALWSPIPWFLAASALFFGLGPLTYSLGDEAMIAYMDKFFKVDSGDLLRTNFLNALGILLITTIFLACPRFMDRQRTRHAPHEIFIPSDRAQAEISACVFLAIGLPLQYLLILPYDLGYLPFILPGVIITLSSLVPLSIFMLAYLASSVGRLWIIGFWGLFCLEVVVECLRFNKSTFLIIFIMAFLGRHLFSQKMIELIIGVFFVSALYVAITPFFNWGRIQVALQSREFFHASLSDRLTIIAEGFELWSMDRLDLERNGSWWVRLNYANSQTLAMNLYDNGRPGDTFGLVVYGPIPRFLWPDKPIIVPGLDFSELAGVGRESHTGIGVFGEAYWNGGWLFVVLSCSYIGVLFALLSRAVLSALARREWLLLPCAFLGIQSGLAITDWFAPAFVNGMLLYLTYYFFIRFVLDIIRKRDYGSELIRG